MSINTLFNLVLVLVDAVEDPLCLHIYFHELLMLLSDVSLHRVEVLDELVVRVALLVDCGGEDDAPVLLQCTASESSQYRLQDQSLMVQSSFVLVANDHLQVVIRHLFVGRHYHSNHEIQHYYLQE